MKRRLLLGLAVGLLSTFGFVADGWCEGDLEFHFIDTGQGDCILVKCPNGRKILVDCGSLGGGDQAEAKSYLQGQLGQPNPSVDVVVITHPDSDHYNWIPDVLTGVQVGSVLTVGAANSHPNGGCETWLTNHPPQIIPQSEHDQPGTPSSRFGPGEVEFFILAANTPTSKNTRSIVVLVSYDDFDAVLMGDADETTESKILDTYSDDPGWLDVELLKVGHHGSKTSSTTNWLTAVKPEMAVVCCWYDNSYQHPRRRTINRIAAHTEDHAHPHFMRWGREVSGTMTLVDVPAYREAIYSTATNGTIVVKTDGSGYSVEYTTRVVTHHGGG